MSDINAEKDFYRRMIAERNEDIDKLNQKIIDLNCELIAVKDRIEVLRKDRDYWIEKLNETESAPNQEQDSV